MKRREVGALFLIWLTACAGTPRAGISEVDRYERELTAARFELRTLTAGAVQDEPVGVASGAYSATLKTLLQRMSPSADPIETARQLFQLEREVEFLAQVENGQIIWATPLKHRLSHPTRDAAAMTREYLKWCKEEHEAADCLGLLKNEAVLQDDGLYAVALALALDSTSVLEESRNVIKEMISPHALVASLVCAAMIYLMLWALPEPISKGIAAVLTVALTAWLGVQTVWNLMTGWVDLVGQIDMATDFAQVRQASQRFGKILGENSARVLVMLICAALGSATGQLATKLPRLPGFSRAAIQAEAQGSTSLAMAGEVESVAASSEGSFAVLMKSRGSAGSASPGGARRPSLTIIQHRNGNKQVMINGERWHLPKDKTVQDIPARDLMGDELQDAASRAAAEWHPGLMSQQETNAIRLAQAKGEHWKANLLESEARGRYVHRTLEKSFDNLRWNAKGVDALDPVTGHRYEILTRTVSNMERHGRRMAEELFRMIGF